jgi:hypothetical protein
MAKEGQERVKRSVVVHPFLFAAFPVLFLFAHNLHLFDVGAIVGNFVILSSLALALWIALALVLKSGQKAGLLISLFLVLLFSYESFFETVRDSVARVDWLVALFIRLGIGAAEIRAILLAVSVAVLGLGAYLLIRARRDLHNLTLVANVVGSALVLMTLIEIAAFEVRVGFDWRGGGVVEATGVSLDETTAPETLPDIYYIILDGYARADVLQELYQHDNADFVEDLSGRGFFVASESRSNYSWTFLSLASSLNMTYLDDLASQVGFESQNRRPAVNMIWHSEVAQFLKDLGYTTVAFETGFWFTEITHADVYHAASWRPDFFQRELIGMTPLPFLARQFGAQDQHGAHRERILYAFDQLPSSSRLDRPVFVFAHILAPHPPFVFGRQGEEIGSESRFTLWDGERIIGEGALTREEYVARYTDQLLFINSKVSEAVDAILSGSSRPTIIILQADHGPRLIPEWEGAQSTSLRERFSILNAYYLPNGDGAELYDSISPVNTFRVILNHYFGAELELLEDESSFSTSDRPYAFVDVTDELRSDAGAEGLD